ncbi:cupin domain-containing protein [Nitrincola tibetensis]|uniref:Cupin domain-containing protein n=1 Tax=Nitrincola tibetensis TaxID=2219697 RepID=A0A364NM75_9GAMM|nr:cupin domain-containing protein [Nitrincola tibetensis]RAU18134.1 cupin domain-containing protein [Nitrincola tibetensis]
MENNHIEFRIKKDVFFSDYVYQKPLLFKQSIHSLNISWDEISEIYERADASDQSFKLMNGYEVPKEEYVEAYINVGKVEHRFIKPVVYDYMRKGATLVYNRIRNEPLVSNISRQIAQFANAQVITSGYAAFSAKSSYRSHWDTRDVFAVQIKGRKRWILKKPTFELPLYMQQTKNIADAKEPEEVYWDIILEAGDVLYVPRGWWHNPIPLDGETFHLAIGTFAPTGFDYLSWLIQFAPDMLEGRRNLHSYEGSQISLESFGREFSALIPNRDMFERFMADYIGQQRVDSKISLGVLANNKVKQLKDSQHVRLNVNMLHPFSNGQMIVNGNRLNVDDIAQNLITYINNHNPCRVKDIIDEFSDYPTSKLHELLFQLALNDVIELISEKFSSIPQTGKIAKELSVI